MSLDQVADSVSDGLKSFYRSARNVASGATDTEIKVRDATNSDKWGPTGQQMKEISDLSQSPEHFNIVMNTIWKRLNDNGKYWRHVYKSLLLLDYMLKNGSEQVVRACLANLHQIRTLRQFQFVSDLGKDEGQNVRQRAKLLVELLGDKDRLREERKTARKNATKYNQAISSDGWGNAGTDSFSNARRENSSGGGGGGGWDDEDDRGDRSTDRSPRRGGGGGGGRRGDSRSPSPDNNRRRNSPSPERRRNNDRDRDRRRGDSRSPSPSRGGGGAGAGGNRPRALSGDNRGQQQQQQQQQPPKQAPQQQQQATSLLFDFPASQQPPQQQQTSSTLLFGAPPVGYQQQQPGFQQQQQQPSFGGFPQTGQPQQQQFLPSSSSSSFGSFPATQSSSSSLGNFPPSQQQPHVQSSSSSLSFDFNPRAANPNSSFVGQPILQQHSEPNVLQPTSFQPQFQQFPQQPAVQPQHQQQQQQQQEWASFSSFQGANSQAPRANDVVTTNHHLYNLDHLSAPANRGGALPEQKKTLAQLAAESNAQHPKQPVLQSAPRPVMTGPTLAPQQLTPQQQYELQIYQQQLLLQQQQQQGQQQFGFPQQQQQNQQFGGFPQQQQQQRLF